MAAGLHERAPRGTARRYRTRGFTVVELLIVISIILVLIALLLPAIQQSRERAREVGCRNNLLQLSIGLCSYQDCHRVLPPGSVSATGPLRSNHSTGRLGWIAQILPFIDQAALWHMVRQHRPELSFRTSAEVAQWERDHTAERNADAEQARPEDEGFPGDSDPGVVPGAGNDGELVVVAPDEFPITVPVELAVLQCPSDPLRGNSADEATTGMSCYAGSHAGSDVPIDTTNDGLLYLNSSESLLAVPDGISTTILLGEHRRVPPGDGWLFGDRGTLRSGGFPLYRSGSRLATELAQLFPDFSRRSSGGDVTEDVAEGLRRWQTRSGPFGSYHSHVNFVFADGAVHRISPFVDPDVLSRLCSRNDGQLVSAGDF